MIEINVKLELSVSECELALFGMIDHLVNGANLSRGFNCSLKTYDNKLPYWSQSLLTNWNYVNDYLPWSCQFNSPSDD